MGETTATPDWAQSIASAENPFAVAITRYARAPVAFVREVLHAEPDPWQLQALRAIAKGHTRVAIRSGHGVGKTAFAAWLVTWFANTRAPFKIAITAPTAPQLFDALWPEIGKWFTRLPSGWRDLWDMTSDHITLKADKECFITARTSRSDRPEAMAGLHSDHILLVADEASGVDEAVFEAAGGSMSSFGAITLLIGNPTRSTGFFWAAHMLERDRWFTMRVSSLDSRRVTPSFVAEIEQRYGLDSNAYRVRVLGEFPSADDNTLIPASLIDAAMIRDVPLDPTQPIYWGVDVARFGADASVLIKRQGNVVPEMPRRWRQFDTMQLSGALKSEYDLATPKPHLIVVDVIGIGAGVVDRLAEQNLPVLGLNVAEAASTTGRFGRMRDELWVRCKEWLETRACRLPRDDQLRDDLASPRYQFLSDGRMQVESKNSMRSRGRPSPDCFVEGTMVATPHQGPRAIETLREGDIVTTPFGPTSVFAVWSSLTDAVTEVAFSDGARLRGTGKHKVFCWGTGVKRLDALIHTDTMEPLLRWRLLAWRLLNLLSTGERNSDFRPLVDIISRAGKTSPSAFCIAVFGQTIMVPCRKVSRSITSMVTGGTMTSPIWACFPKASINGFTCWPVSPSRERLSETPSIWRRRAWPPPSGTAPRTGRRSIVSWAWFPGRTANRGLLSVNSAALRSPRAGPRGRRFVPGVVGTDPGGRPEPTRPRSPIRAFARGVVRRFSRTGIGRRRVVPVSVATESVPPTRVWNLTLLRHNAYYANGILVFNCADALIHTFAQAGLGIGTGMTAGLFDREPARMAFGPGEFV